MQFPMRIAELYIQDKIYPVSIHIFGLSHNFSAELDGNKYYGQSLRELEQRLKSALVRKKIRLDLEVSIQPGHGGIYRATVTSIDSRTGKLIVSYVDRNNKRKRIYMNEYDPFYRRLNAEDQEKFYKLHTAHSDAQRALKNFLEIIRINISELVKEKLSKAEANKDNKQAVS